MCAMDCQDGCGLKSTYKCTSVKHRLHFWMLARRLGKAVWVRCGGQPPQRCGHITPRYCSTTWFGDFMPRQGFQILLDRRW